jgi:transcriptional regulator
MQLSFLTKSLYLLYNLALMYKMPEFTEKDNALVLSFIREHPFVTLIGNDGDTPVATQVPLLIEEGADGQLQLRGHIMRGTDHYKAFEKNNKVLLLFTGANCYVSASWYKERHIGSTWNYMTVHLRGRIQFMDFDGTVQMIKDLTHKYEGPQQHPELVENMPAEYVDGMVKAISGFTIDIESITPIFKLSQNRSDESYKHIVSKLEAQNDNGAEEIAGEMIKRRLHLFNS